MSAYAIVVLISAFVIVAAAAAAAAFRLGSRRAGAPPGRDPRDRRDEADAETSAALARQRGDLDERARRAERADELRNLLVSKMSHDLRTPLNSVITLSQLLYDGSAGSLTSEQRKYVDVVRRNGQALLGLVNDIVDLAGLEAGRLEVEASTVDLGEVARATVAAATADARRKGLPLRLNLPRAGVYARADEERLRHALSALVDHAVAGTRNGYVEITVEGQDTRPDGAGPGTEAGSGNGGRARSPVPLRGAVVRVADTGGGLSAEARGALFDDFLAALGPFSGRATPPLSLVVAARLIRLMGGTVTIDATGGDGTILSVTLPGATAEVADEAKDGAREGASDADRGTPSGSRTVEESDALDARDGARPLSGAGAGSVLLIEDDELERRRVGSTLAQAGYDVTSASSGEEGLALLAAGRYDAVVLDLVMPGMTGLDVLRRARADERMAGTPFVVLSALYMTKSERDVLGPGVAAVVRKGDGTAAELVGQLRRAIARGPAPSAAADLQADASAVRARVLVVEDNVDNLFTIEQVLASLPVAIQTAASGAEAIEICRRHPPDLIMMDVELPGMSGLEASRTIHALPDCERIPIIALTADAMHGDRERALAAQCSAYLAKPVQPLDVVSAVTRALQLSH